MGLAESVIFDNVTVSPGIRTRHGQEGKSPFVIKIYGQLVLF